MSDRKKDVLKHIKPMLENNKNNFSYSNINKQNRVKRNKLEGEGNNRYTKVHQEEFEVIRNQQIFYFEKP